MTVETSLREEQMARTRERLLEAAAQLLADDSDIGFRAIAERAGVSAPTVYRHFSTPDELLPALLVHLETRMGVSEHPTTLTAYLELLPRIFATFEEHAPYMRAWLRASRAQEVRVRTRTRRVDSVVAALPDEEPFADGDRARRLAGLIVALGGSPTWQTLTDITDLRGDDAGRLVAWAVAALVDTARRDPGAFAEAATPHHPEEPS